MRLLDIVFLLVTTVAVLFAARCYFELWKWARQCQQARIAIAYKRKVKGDWPLVEFVKWCNQLDKDKDARGRAIYMLGGTTVVIRKKVIPPTRIHRFISKWKNRNVPPPAQTGNTDKPGMPQVIEV